MWKEYIHIKLGTVHLELNYKKKVNFKLRWGIVEVSKLKIDFKKYLKKGNLLRIAGK